MRRWNRRRTRRIRRTRWRTKRTKRTKGRKDEKDEKDEEYKKDEKEEEEKSTNMRDLPVKRFLDERGLVHVQDVKLDDLGDRAVGCAVRSTRPLEALRGDRLAKQHLWKTCPMEQCQGQDF